MLDRDFGAAQFNREFAPLYKNFTGGSEWLGNFPTEPPKHHLWRADYFGQEHLIQSRETHFVELPPQERLHRMGRKEMRRNVSDFVALQEYREPGVMNIKIKAVSVSPRIFQIDGFLSDVEVNQYVWNRHILQFDLTMRLTLSFFPLALALQQHP